MRVFMSYASVDKPLALQIREAFESHGISAWLDEADLRVGQSIPAEARDALHASDIVCILISSALTNSMRVARELNSFLPLFRDGSRVLLPCRIDSSPLPAGVQDMKYADFTKGFEAGIAELLDAVKIREGVIESKRLEAKWGETLAELSEEELKFFLDWTDGDSIYIEADEEALRLERPSHLEKLTRVGLAERHPTCRADVWYAVSADGAALQKLFGEGRFSFR